MKYFFVSLFTFWAFNNLLSQSVIVPRDTSFTIEGTYAKESKKRPYIQIACPSLPNNAKQELNLVYKSIGKRDILLDIYYPATIQKLKPAVLLIFGGGWSSGDKTHNNAMSFELVKHGFVAISPEYRLTLEAKYPAAVFDLKDAIKWMKANAFIYGIDTNKIAVLGCSAGGQLASLLGTTNFKKQFEDTMSVHQHTSNIQAVVNIDGTLAFHHPESVEGKAAANWFGGAYTEATKNWEEAAPLTQVDSTTVPFIFINSSIPRFHAGRTDFIAQLNKWNIYSEVHEFADTPHPFWFFYPWFNDMMDDITKFLSLQFKL